MSPDGGGGRRRGGGQDLIQTVPAGSGPIFFFFSISFIFVSFCPAPLRDPPPFSCGRMGGEFAQLLRDPRKDEGGTTWCPSYAGTKRGGGGERKSQSDCTPAERQNLAEAVLNLALLPVSHHFSPVVLRLRPFF